MVKPTLLYVLPEPSIFGRPLKPIEGFKIVAESALSDGRFAEAKWVDLMEMFVGLAPIDVEARRDRRACGSIVLRSDDGQFFKLAIGVHTLAKLLVAALDAEEALLDRDPSTGPQS